MVKVRDEFYQPAHGYQGLEGYVPKQLAQSGGSPASDLNLQSLIGTEIAVRLRLDGIKVEYGNLDGINNIYIGGYLNDVTDFDPDAVTTFTYTTPDWYDYDCFVAKLDPNGNFVWAKKWGGTDFSARPDPRRPGADRPLQGLYQGGRALDQTPGPRPGPALHQPAAGGILRRQGDRLARPRAL